MVDTLALLGMIVITCVGLGVIGFTVRHALTPDSRHVTKLLTAGIALVAIGWLGPRLQSLEAGPLLSIKLVEPPEQLNTEALTEQASVELAARLSLAFLEEIGLLPEQEAYREVAEDALKNVSEFVSGLGFIPAIAGTRPGTLLKGGDGQWSVLSELSIPEGSVARTLVQQSAGGFKAQAAGLTLTIQDFVRVSVPRSTIESHLEQAETLLRAETELFVVTEVLSCRYTLEDGPDPVELTVPVGMRVVRVVLDGTT